MYNDIQIGRFLNPFFLLKQLNNQCTRCFSPDTILILQFYKINKFPKIEILNSIGHSKVHSRDLFNFPNLNSEIFYLYLEPHSFQHKQTPSSFSLLTPSLHTEMLQHSHNSHPPSTDILFADISI